MRTLYHQVRFPENQAILLDDYHFCFAKACDTAYFSPSGNIIPKHYLKTYQELQHDKLCYCFDIDTSDYTNAIDAHQSEALKNFVIKRTKNGECACEIRNPSGQCCLAQFKKFQQ